MKSTFKEKIKPSAGLPKVGDLLIYLQSGHCKPYVVLVTKYPFTGHNFSAVVLASTQIDDDIFPGEVGAFNKSEFVPFHGKVELES